MGLYKDMNLEVIVLAAGKGTRMRSDQPKVLHKLAGRSLLDHVLESASRLQPKRIHVIVGHRASEVRKAFALSEHPLNWVVQSEQLGTGHAVKQALPAVDDEALVLVLAGDVPLITSRTLDLCVQAGQSGNLGLVTACFDQPGSLGRIVRSADGQHIERIIEAKDANDRQLAIKEINSGIMTVKGERLRTLVGRIDNNNAQNEYYLTDIIELANREGINVEGILIEDPDEVTGINDRVELARAERLMQQRIALDLMESGVTLADPARLDVRGSLTTGPDCYIDVNVVVIGDVKLGAGVSIASGVVIEDSTLGDNVRVEPNTVIQGALVASDCTLGPFARIRPGTQLGREVRIGNFVETKKAILGDRTKANHLAYLGDATLGADCNVGAGTITCNYDGISKHPTEVGDQVFVGSNSTLVAPLVIDSGAFVAAGSTITTRVKQGDLAVGRGKQRNISGWVRPDMREKT
jgi:bifunctional UDP-N-acetylglucosamine pyrophosphorylase/glucosamine-1-phosphate N-acetyltransferase